MFVFSIFFFFLGGKTPSLCSSGLLAQLLGFWYLKGFKVSLNHLAEVTQVGYWFFSNNTNPGGLAGTCQSPCKCISRGVDSRRL